MDLKQVYNNAFIDELQKTAKGKYPIVEDEVGKDLVTGAVIAGGGGAGYKIGDKVRKMLNRRGGKYRYAGAAIGALSGAALRGKLKKSK